MSVKTEVENVRTTGPEKILAAVLAIFILIGAVWVYSQIGKVSNDSYEWEYGQMPGPRIELSQPDRDALRERRQADSASWQARNRLRQAENDVTLAGDAYRTELDAGQSGEAELAEYRQAQRRLTTARSARRRAEARQEAVRPAAAEAEAHRAEALREARAEQRRDDRWVAVLRLLLVGILLGTGYWSLAITRRRRSRTMPLALAWISAAALLAAWMALDYGLEAAVFREVGPLVISVAGILLTVLAFAALQRYLARRIPLRRVRKRECPFCGYPSHGSLSCEGCGRQVIGECSTCHQPRRVGTPYCGTCGAP